jgi:hypothetical protein
MSSRRHSSAQLLVSATVCLLLLCAVTSAELPDLLSLTDNTANDFVGCKVSSAESIRFSSAVKQGAIQFAGGAVEYKTVELGTVKVEGASSMRSGLFALHAVLRR